MVLFSQYLGWLNVPCFGYNRKSRTCESKGYQVFKMFPVVLSISVSWLVCFLLTITDVFPSDPAEWGYGARTDTRMDAIYDAPWFRVPYPCQWGWPSVDIACVCGLLSGIVATMVESIGDYTACASLAGAPPPPQHAINRGIFVEGVGSFLDGLFGTGNGTTSTSVNVGVIGLTKVGSRSVVMVSALFMIAFGVLNKVGALFITVPDPVIGGTFIILFGMIVAVGLSNLQYVDLNSGRNLFIIGFSLFMGLCVPQWIKRFPTSIHTGSTVSDNVIYVLLSTGMFVGGVIGFILDNTIPGTDEERGMKKWRQEVPQNTDKSHDQQKSDNAKRMQLIYGFPCGMELVNKVKCLRYIPVCPTFGMKDPDMEDKPGSDVEGVTNVTYGTVSEITCSVTSL